MSLQDRRTKSPSPPAVMVVMGVSGSGKSTIGALLARRLHWEFEDADWLHPAANVDKMHSGIPLTDEDRWPWLHAVAAWIDKTRVSGGHAVVACSALKRKYRDELRVEGVHFVYLKGDYELIEQRLRARHGHFASESILKSQFEGLEKPDDAITVEIDKAPEAIVAEIIEKLKSLPNSCPDPAQK